MCFYSLLVISQPCLNSELCTVEIFDTACCTLCRPLHYGLWRYIPSVGILEPEAPITSLGPQSDISPGHHYSGLHWKSLQAFYETFVVLNMFENGQKFERVFCTIQCVF